MKLVAKLVVLILRTIKTSPGTQTVCFLSSEVRLCACTGLAFKMNIDIDVPNTLWIFLSGSYS